jgi:hypothetical protein
MNARGLLGWSDSVSVRVDRTALIGEADNAVPTVLFPDPHPPPPLSPSGSQRSRGRDALLMVLRRQYQVVQRPGD